MTEYDLIVIGSGPGGYVAAIRAGQLGMKTLVVEKDARFGGTCLLRGCIPTKALLHTASLLEEVRKASDFGVRVGSADLDLETAHAYKSGVVDRNARGVEYLFRKNKVETARGRGRLVGAHEVAVEGEEGGTTHRARHVLIATGSVPRDLPHVATDGERIVNSDHILETSRVPERLVVVGSGAVGCEFASIFAAFGAQVVLVEMLPRVLPLEDEEISKELARAFRKRNIKVATETTLGAVRRRGEELEIELEKKGMTESSTADMLLIATGRAPVTGDLGLETLGVRLDRGYVEVNETMQTAVPHLYAVGDVVKTPWLAHVASAEGILAVEHMAGLEARPLNYDHVPSVTYCEPEVGSVGLSEAEARERGYDVAVGKFPFSALGKALIEGRTEGFVKVVREKKYDELLGVHIIGGKATDLIAEACVALRVEATTEELFRAIHAHPTLSEAVAEAAHAAVGHAIHI